jgi:hypothetical protein
VLGLDLPEEEITRYLQRLGFAVKNAKGYFNVVPPSYRADVQRDSLPQSDGVPHHRRLLARRATR